MFYVVEVDNDGFKVYDSGGTLIDPAKDSSVQSVLTALTAIKDTDGIKKITDALPTGDNTIGRVKLTDGTYLLLLRAEGDAWTTQPGIPIVARDKEDVVRRLIAEEDGTLIVASKPPSAPPGTTPFVLAGDTPLEIGPVPAYHETVSPAIGNGLNLYLQTIAAGAAGDPTENGSKVEVYWREGTGPTNHLITRIYLSGQTVNLVLPNVNAARDGTALTGNGTNTYLVIRRERLSTAAQEIDAEVRGYTES